MLNYFKQIWNSPDLRKKILFTLGILALYRLIAHVTVPGVETESLRAVAEQNDLLQVFSLLTGGSTENFSIVLMGISPYINASIIMQLLTVIVPRMEQLSKEGNTGRQKINSYTRWLTFPLAFLQSYGMLVLLNSQANIPLVSDISDPAIVLPIMLTISAGTLLLVWLGEQISEKGIGNGISLLIFTSIIANVPAMIGQGLFLATEDQTRLIPFAVVILITLILTTVIILVNEAARRIPITYAGRGIRAGSEQSFLPIRINQTGMIPIIFAVALVNFPGILAQFLQNATSEGVRAFGAAMSVIFQPQTTTYLVIYFLLVIAFSYFYVSITFKPEEIAENIQRRGGYVPGIRPGKQTSEYIADISSRLTLFGGLFLATIAILPMMLQFLFRTTAIGSVPLLISGAGMIIIVGVVLELIRQVNSELVMHDYKKFY